MENQENRAPEYTMEQGVLRCVVPDLSKYYREAPARVLALFVAAAAKGCPVEADTYMAAMDNLDGVRRLPAGIFRSALQNILLSQRPEAVAPLLNYGVLEPFGLKGPAPCLHLLNDVPCTMETRWWSLLHMLGANYAVVCGQLGFSDTFAGALSALDSLSTLKQLPAAVLELKELLCRLPEVDYPAAARTFALHDPRWNGQAELYDKLYRSGEPYRMRELAISTGQLAVLGIRDKKAAWVRQRLLEAVIKAPETNQYPALEMLARTLAQQYKG